MPAPFALVSRRVTLRDGIAPRAVLVEDGRIAGLAAAGEVPSRFAAEDLGERALLPGLVDTHVHINEPGREEWEGFATATRAAAAGGTTALLDMPLNSVPVTTTRAALAAKRAAAAGKLFVDCGFVGGVVPGNAGELAGLAADGARAFKCFLIHSGIDEFGACDEATLRRAMAELAVLGLPLLAHAELAGPAPAPAGDPRAYGVFLASRPRSWENAAIELLIRLARETGCRVHVVHLSSAEALPALARARAEGVPVTVETCPHYLTFDAESIPAGRTEFKCCPPIREADNRERLWQGLAEGTIDFVVSDHSPCTADLKLPAEGDFLKAWGGIASLSLVLPALWTEARRRGFTLAQVAAWLSAKPAAFAGLAGKGRIAAGADADLVVLDPEAEAAVESGRLPFRNKLTPYAGLRLLGGIERVYLRGEKIYDTAGFSARPLGREL